MARPKTFDENQTLEKAVGLFWRKGYHASSIQDVVDTLGINRASLYDTYGDKHTLYVKALQRYRAAQSQAMTEIMQEQGGAVNRIKTLLETIIETALNDPERKGCFMVNTAMELVNQDAEIARIAADYQRETENALEQLIRDGQRSGEFTMMRDARVLAQFVFCSINGLQLAGKTNPDRNTLGQIAGMVLKALQPEASEALI